jgi:hypothetical protein
MDLSDSEKIKGGMLKIREVMALWDLLAAAAASVDQL